MSRRSRPTDSLDLLLDTICNTFGGVLFIAILVVILLQLSGARRTEDPEAAVPLATFRRVQNRHAAVAAKLERRRAAAASRRAMLAEVAPAELRDLVHKRRRLTKRRNERQVELDETLAENVALAEKGRRIRAANEAIQQSLARARQRRKSLADTLAKLRDRRTRELALPEVRSPHNKQEIAFNIRYGRLYLWHHYSESGIRQGLNTKEFVVIGRHEQTGGLITQPKPTAGIPLDGSPTSERAMRAKLAPFSPQDDYICIVVRGDSFGEFPDFRDLLIELGFQYRLMPVPPNSTVIDRGGRGGRVQ